MVIKSNDSISCLDNYISIAKMSQDLLLPLQILSNFIWWFWQPFLWQATFSFIKRAWWMKTLLARTIRWDLIKFAVATVNPVTFLQLKCSYPDMILCLNHPYWPPRLQTGDTGCFYYMLLDAGFAFLLCTQWQNRPSQTGLVTVVKVFLMAGCSLRSTSLTQVSALRQMPLRSTAAPFHWLKQ